MGNSQRQPRIDAEVDMDSAFTTVAPTQSSKSLMRGRESTAIHVLAQNAGTEVPVPMQPMADALVYQDLDRGRQNLLNISELDLGKTPKDFTSSIDWDAVARLPASLCMGVPISRAFCGPAHPLASLVPNYMSSSLLRNVSSCASAMTLFNQGQWDKDHMFAQTSSGLGSPEQRLHSPKKRRNFKRSASGIKDDVDYMPSQKLPRIKKAHSGGLQKYKSPGRTRLTLAGTASCIRDLDPNWRGSDGPMVLVAKTLTKSDTLGRVILPRIAVETNMSFLTRFSDFVEHRAYTLAVTDLNGKPWQFVVKSWANGSEARRVYVLEQALLFLRTNQLREGDVVGICCDEQGSFQVAANTPELTEAVLRPSFGMTIPKRHAETLYGSKKVQHQRPLPGDSAVTGPAHSGLYHGSSSHELQGGAVRRGHPAAAPPLPELWLSDEVSAQQALKPCSTISEPLTAADLESGQARFPLMTTKEALNLWQNSSLVVQAGQRDLWSLRATDRLREGLLILNDLGDIYAAQNAQTGDLVTIEVAAQGAPILKIIASPHKQEATAPAREQDQSVAFVQVKCRSLQGRFDVSTATVQYFNGLRLETLLPSDFIQEAGGDPNVDWMDALIPATSSHPTTLRSWLQRRGIVLGSRNGHAPPVHRSTPREVRRRSSQRSSNTDWASESAKDRGLAAEDSMAAEVLMSLGRPSSEVPHTS